MSRISTYLKENLSPRRALVLVPAIFLLLFPAVARQLFPPPKDYYVLTILIFANVYAVYAASWDLLAGVTGQFSFGHAIFFGVAAYASGALNKSLELPPWMTIPIGGALGVIVGLVVGLPSLRLKGPYFAIATMVFPGILAAIFLSFPELTGGEGGLSGLTPISLDISVTYYSSLLLMLASIFTLVLIVNSRIGLVFRSIREDEDAAEAMGISTTRYKFLSFVISGFFAGIAGAFQSHLPMMMFIGPYIFHPYYSFMAIIYASLGGIGTIIGSVGGSYLLYIVNELLKELERFGIGELRMLIYAVVMVIVIRYLREGLIRRAAMRLNIPLGIWKGVEKLRRM